MEKKLQTQVGQEHALGLSDVLPLKEGWRDRDFALKIFIVCTQMLGAVGNKRTLKIKYLEGVYCSLRKRCKCELGQGGLG